MLESQSNKLWKHDTYKETQSIHNEMQQGLKTTIKRQKKNPKRRKMITKRLQRHKTTTKRCKMTPKRLSNTTRWLQREQNVNKRLQRDTKLQPREAKKPQRGSKRLPGDAKCLLQTGNNCIYKAFIVHSKHFTTHATYLFTHIHALMAEAVPRVIQCFVSYISKPKDTMACRPDRRPCD